MDRRLTVKERHLKEKYETTSTFVWHNSNDHGVITGDCVVRAISTALDLPWGTVMMELFNIALPMGEVFNDRSVYNKFLDKQGYWMNKQPRKADNTKYTGTEFCKYLTAKYPKGEIGTVIAHIGGHHLVCIKPWVSGDGVTCKYKVYDTWNSTSGCIGNYWSKKFIL